MGFLILKLLLNNFLQANRHCLRTGLDTLSWENKNYLQIVFKEQKCLIETVLKKINSSVYFEIFPW